MGRNPGEPAMGRQLEEWADTISGEFNSQDVANTLWAFSTMGRKPGKRTMGQLEERTEAIFQAAESCKRTVGVGDNWEAAGGADAGAAWRGGRRRYLGSSSRRKVANTLWACATIGRNPGERMMGQLERRVESISGELQTRCVVSEYVQGHLLKKTKSS